MVEKRYNSMRRSQVNQDKAELFYIACSWGRGRWGAMDGKEGGSEKLEGGKARERDGEMSGQFGSADHRRRSMRRAPGSPTSQS